MTTKVLLLVIASTASLWGCSSAPTQLTNAGSCNQGACFIDVTVTDCRVSVNPDKKRIARGNKGPVIHWRMDGASFAAYRFADKGISWKRNPDNEFHAPGKANFGKHFTWTDKNSLPGDFPYTVHLVRRGTGEPCAPHDPSVVND